MDTKTILLLGAGAAALYYFYSKDGDTTKGTDGMGRRIHRPADYKAAAVVVGANAAAARKQRVSERLRKMLHDSIVVRGGEHINVAGKNTIYLGDSNNVDTRRAWDDLVANEAAFLANRSEFAQKPSIKSSLSEAEYFRRYGRYPSNIYRTKWSPRKPADAPTNLAD
jgi:hypothetical protein